MHYGGIHGDLHLEQPQDIVDSVEARDWRDAHEVGHVDQRLRLEHAELSILCEQVSILKKVCGKELVLLE